MTQTASIRTVACTGTAAQCGSASGWVVDLPETGERVNVDMRLALGTLVFGSNVPQDSACTTGGHSWLNFLDFGSGLAVSTSAGLAASVQSTDSLIVGLNVLTVNGKTIAVRSFADATRRSDEAPTAGVPPVGKRISWREIAQ